MDEILKVEGLKTSFMTSSGEVQAVRGVSFGVRKGEILGIVGESGSGKSVTSMTILRLLAERGHTVVITSDHGTIRVDNPVKVTGDRETSSNLRYKTGRNLAYNSREVYEVLRPEDIQLPSSNLTSSYIFAYNSDFLVYNNDANRHIRYYRNTFQHGGISMEEMIVPYIVLKPKQ